MRATGYSFETLKSALSCLPNLRRLRFLYSGEENGMRFRNPPRVLGIEFYCMAKVMCNPSLFWGGSNQDTAYDITTVLAALAPKALSTFECQVFNVNILDFDSHCDTNGNVPPHQFVKDTIKDTGFPLVCATFKSLTVIELSFTQSEKSRGPWQKLLGEALSGAQALKTLRIEHEAPGTSSRTENSFPLSQNEGLFAPLLGSSTWPNLTHLSLSSFTIYPDDLPSFFARHPTLTHFTLDSPFAHNFDWAILLQSPSLTPHLHRLHSLTFTGTFGATPWTNPLAAINRARLSHIYHPTSSDNNIRYQDLLTGLNRTVDMDGPFASWAKRLTGAHDLSELLARYFAGGAEGAAARPFPLRSSREVVQVVLEDMKEGRWVHPDGGRNVWVAEERVAGGKEYRYKDVYRDAWEY
jgi:hypothetical protein